ncbi:GNAT family N-acetyltransferase [Psychrobacter sp. F1192]|uniref:GNAT family N-acetyltransferase n=1 Tax=Psychrobacter coccoides TaxID=2818440 RepID=A0ABS3NRV2_9GAMM|nr:GNAT family N-acetyltransferase [Psychrobacter coccoides]MBO1531765.1 GNAT family N-acetyltransferase [Psychrobacter coccoides]
MKVTKLSSDYANKISELCNQELDQLYLLGTAYQSPKLSNYLKFICEEKLEEFYGVKDGDELVAVIQYRKPDSYLHINHMVVTSSHQGLGLGKKLLFWAFKQAELSNLDVSLDVDLINKKAFDWYLASGFKVASETKTSILDLKSQNPNTIVYHDKENLANFGFSNANIEGLEGLSFYFVEPNTLLLKNITKLENDTLDKLYDAVNGLLVVNSDALPENTLSASIYNKVMIGMVKPMN